MISPDNPYIMSEEKSKTFLCSICSFSGTYHYFGTNPTFSRHAILMEDSYVCKDPFSSDGGFITLGSHCGLCKTSVCCSTDCSLFYTQRFCLKCVKSKLDQFPLQIQQEISRKT